MCTTDSQIKSLKSRLRMLRRINRPLPRRTVLAVLGLLTASLFASANARAEFADWELKNIEDGSEAIAAAWTPDHFATGHAAQPSSAIRFLHASEVVQPRMADARIAPAEFDQSGSDDPPLPAYLRPFNPSEEVPPPPVPEGQAPDQSVTAKLEEFARRIDELEQRRIAQEDATRSIIRKSFAERASNITDAVAFGGTLETLTFWQSNFDGTHESDIRLDTAELDFDITMNTWSHGALYIEYFSGDDFLFPTNAGDEVGVDRFIVRRGTITIGNTEKYPVYATTGRDFVPFGISTGDPVLDVLTITDPLTVEVFQTQEDFVMFGFELPTAPPPAPVSAYARPPVAPRPILFNPLVRTVVHEVCPYCGPLDKAKTVAATPYTCVAPFTGAIYFYNGNTLEGVNDPNAIKQMGGSLGYRAKGTLPDSCTPWSLNCNIDANSSVFDSNFLQFEYRHFLPQIGFVPGMAAHMRSSLGPYGLVLEWNGAVGDARFVDDAGNPVSIRPSAWQIAFNYQFDWNPTVETIGTQGTYLAMGYSESSDLFGVTRIVDPLNPVPQRVGSVPERRFSIGVGEWVLDGCRVAFEYSHAFDYSVAEGGTGNSADAVLMQWTYEW
jgi:hypothetical protein